MTKIMRRVGATVAATVLWGCSSAGPFGYARTYVPTDAERSAAAPARSLDLVMAQRRPDAWSAQPVSFFGVVSKAPERQGDATLLTVSLRRLEKRNLCRDGAQDSCRVTVSEKVFGSVRVRVRLQPDDSKGPDRVEPGSLLRVIGDLEMPAGGSDEPPTVTATYYRHWPAQHYVTTAARKYMRR